MRTTDTQIKIADVVTSLNGRDAGKRFLVLETQGEYSFIADGKGRKAGKPKKKKNKHLIPEDEIGPPIAAKILGGEKVTNNEIRRALAQFATAQGERGGI